MKEKKTEPRVIFAGVRDSEDDKGFPCFDIECRFSDGQKFAAVQVDGDFPELAQRIAEFLISSNAELRGASRLHGEASLSNDVLGTGGRDGTGN